MKRRKDDEKIMEPMFPRLHVNDTEKGGPRAPPRNKMALYEQLTHRFNPSSSSQGSDLERNMFYMPDNIHTRQLGEASVNALTVQPRKKVGDEEDFLVPVFLNSETDQQHSKIIFDNDPNRNSSVGVGLRKEVRDHSEESSKVCSSREHSIRTSAHLSTRERIDGYAKEDNVSRDQGCGEIDASRLSGSLENDACSLQKSKTGRQQVNNGCTVDAASMTGIGGEGSLSRKRSLSYSEGNDYVPDETNIDGECHVDKTCGYVHLANGDKSDDASEASMVDSVSSSDISPDDVVGIIGQKRFWKARRAIVNQQRVFAVQVFELHRLIKVQKLIAGSPHILLEDMAYLSKPFKDSPTKKHPPELIVQSLPHAKRKEDTEKLSHEMECSAENAVGRTSLSSVENGSQPSYYGPFLGNPQPSPVNGDSKMNPWGFNQMLGQQWLVPVMSPSEGLVYKPYPGPGFMGSACGGCGPFGQTPMTGNFMASVYGVSAPPHQGLGVLPGAPLAGHSYFPPYRMPVMNPTLTGSSMEQMNLFSGSGSHAQSGQISGNGANVDMQQQSSCNQPGKKNGDVPPVMKFQASKDDEQQRCAASSPAKRSEKDGAHSAAEGKNAPPLLPPVGVSQPHDTDQRTRVIRVVPHNPRSATESAARIFRSIQKKRKQYD